MEETILQNLMNNENYFTKVFTHLRADLFTNEYNKIIFEVMSKYIEEYNAKPSFKEVGLTIKESKKINKNTKQAVLEKFKDIFKEIKVENQDFLMKQTILWIQRMRLTQAVFKSADIIQADEAFEPIVEMFEEALNVYLDNDIGLDYSTTIEERLEFYKNKEVFTSTGIKSLDKALGGGIRPSSLFLLVAPTHMGKTALKVFLTVNLLLKKENVLFITLEMPEKEIAKRIDANLMGTTINELSEIPNEDLEKKWNNIKDNIGQLVIKEYGAGTFNTNQLKALLEDLKTKKDFIPDAIVVDYIGLMTSHRVNKNSNSYDSLGKVAEDLHAIAKETFDSKGNKGIKMITSSQSNRNSIGNTEAGMENISESLKIAMTADVAIMLISNDQMKEQNQQIFKFLKNRYTGQLVSTIIETDFPRMMYKDFSSTSTDEVINNIDTGMDFGKIVF